MVLQFAAKSRAVRSVNRRVTFFGAKLTALEADFDLIVVVALESGPKLALEEGEENGVDGGRAAFLSGGAGGGSELSLRRAVLALHQHELGLQWHVPAGHSHPLRHPP